MVRIIAPLCLAGLAYSAQVQKSQWQAYKSKFNKLYASSEDASRFSTYANQMEEIAAHNTRFDAGLESYRQGETPFTDMSAEEVKKTMNGYGKSGRRPGALELQYPCDANFHPSGYMPDQVNWVNEGAVTCIKNQMFCGDCWAFSAAACMEGAVFMAGNGPVQSLSAQEVTDCASSNTTMGPYSNDGCNGGWPQNAFYYAIENTGMEPWLAYPFSDVQEQCQYNPALSVASFSTCTDVTFGDETTLAYASAQIGPISIAIDAGLNSFHNYVDGIYYAPHCSDSALDHAVTLVGFGIMPEIDPSIITTCTNWDFMCQTFEEGIMFEYPCMTTGAKGKKMTEYTAGENCNPPDGIAGEKFWIVKNSWGPLWGMSGYIMMARDMDNNCGVASAPSYVVAN